MQLKTITIVDAWLSSIIFANQNSFFPHFIIYWPSYFFSLCFSSISAPRISHPL